MFILSTEDAKPQRRTGTRGYRQRQMDHRGAQELERGRRQRPAAVLEL